MKKFAKSLMLAAALVFAASVGAGNTAEAAKATVKSVKAVDKLTGKKTVTLAKGKKATLKTTVSVSGKAKKTVSYKSSKKSVATVSKKGVITAKKKTGTAKITVTSKVNTKKKAKVTVKVVAGNVTKVTVDAIKDLTVGDTATLKATVKATKKANKTLVWSSDNKSVATVDKKTGKVTAVKAGTAKITAKATDGTGKKAYVTVKVVDKAVAPVVTKKTTIAPKSGASVDVVVKFTDAAKAQADVDKLAAVAVKAGQTLKVNIDGTDYVASFDGKNVKINDKLISEKVSGAKTVAVKASVNTDKIAALTAFVPASVEFVEYQGVKFEKITDKTFVIGAKTFNYTVSGKNIVVDGDAQADFVKLAGVATITVK